MPEPPPEPPTTAAALPANSDFRTFPPPNSRNAAMVSPATPPDWRRSANFLRANLFCAPVRWTALRYNSAMRSSMANSGNCSKRTITASGYDWDNSDRNSNCVFTSFGVELAMRSRDLRWMSCRREVRKVRFWDPRGWRREEEGTDGVHSVCSVPPIPRLVPRRPRPRPRLPFAPDVPTALLRDKPLFPNVGAEKVDSPPNSRVVAEEAANPMLCPLRERGATADDSRWRSFLRPLASRRRVKS